jgi:hypothetical protein
MPFLGGRRIGQPVHPGFPQGATLGVGHAFDHFEAEVLRDAVAAGDPVSVSEVEEVVGGHPEVNGAEVLGLEREGHHALPVGVRVALGIVAGERPAAERGLHPLHLHVGALDDAHPDRAAPGRNPALGPIRQLLEHPEGVRQVGLERHAGRDVLERLAVESSPEGGRGQGEIPESLHVKVDRFGRTGAVRAHICVGGGLAEEPAEPPTE